MEVAASNGHEVVKVRQHATDSVVLSSQRLLERQILHNVGSQPRRERSSGPKAAPVKLWATMKWSRTVTAYIRRLRM